jgi:hypothetical protein
MMGNGQWAMMGNLGKIKTGEFQVPVSCRSGKEFLLFY